MPKLRNNKQPTGKVDWETPDDLMWAIRGVWGWFDLDPCATESTNKASRYIGPDAWDARYRFVSIVDIEGGRVVSSNDGLEHTWRGKIYCNPPYGRSIAKWVQKCHDEVACGHAELVVALLPVAVGTRWWQDWCSKATEIRFLKGRVTFVGAPAPSAFESAIVVWRRGMLGFHHVSYWDWREQK